MNTDDEGKRNGDSRAEIEEAVREYLRGKPRILRLLLERFCDAVDGEEAEKVEATPAYEAASARNPSLAPILELALPSISPPAKIGPPNGWPKFGEREYRALRHLRRGS